MTKNEKNTPYIGEPMKTLAKQKKIVSFKQKIINARKEMTKPLRGGDNDYKNYKYVTLEDLYNATIPALLNNGLFVTNYKTFINDRLVLVTEIKDAESDMSISTFGVLNETLKIQDHGGELTYHSRYNLGNLLSIRTDFDDDAQGIANVKPVKMITKEQVDKLKKLINGNKTMGRMIRESYKFNLLTEIPEDKFETILTAINLYKIKEAKEAANGSI